MINHIAIKNFAIIENTEFDFEDGLNIITGETGSGKSIVIEAISLALGNRADSGYIRHGMDRAIVQLSGDLDGEETVITREVSTSGKNVCKLNGQLVTLSQLSETCRRLADIHGQYDNQSLLNSEHHLELVDSYHYSEIAPIKESFQNSFDNYRREKSKLNMLLSMESENKKKIDFYRFEKNEIDNASLKPGEDSELEERISLLQNSEKIFDGIETAYTHIYNGENSAMADFGTGLRALDEISEYSTEISKISSDFKDMYYKLEDIATVLRSIREEIAFAPDELDKAIARLNLIDNLKKKYSSNIEGIISYGEKISLSLEQFENFDEEKETLETSVANCYSKVKKDAESLTSARKKSAVALAKAIENELHDLNFGDAKMHIFFNEPEKIGPKGNDIAEIMISTNKGEPMKPLAKIASGGEISRIMLAIKNITVSYDKIPTMIFDEIDAGISGVTASIVGKKLRDISRSHQIICITHLPQIAACGDSNYRIFKESNEKSTFTHVEKLTYEQKVTEIARLLGGTDITETTKANARELISASAY